MNRRLMVGVASLAVLASATACTPREVQMWVDWHDQDPAAAEEFANQPEVQADLASGEHEQRQAAPARSSGGGTVWDRLAQCESGGNWAINTGNGYSGGLQFLHSSWRAYGGSGQAWQHSRAEQIAVAERILADVGWGAWPACSRKLGLR